MNSKVLLFSDLHLHDWSFGSTISKGGYNSRLTDGLQVIDQVYLEASLRDIKTIIFCGDLFHTRQGVSSYVMSRTFRTLQECSRVYPDINLFILLGNHDFTRDMGFSSVECFNLIPRIMVISKLTKISTLVSGLNMVFVPYTPDPEKFKASLDCNYDVAFVHQGFSDLLVDPRNYYIDEISSVEDMALWRKDKSVEIISGHYHDHSLLSGKDKDVFNLFGFFVGSPMQHSFKDVGCSRGFLVYEFGSRNPEFFSLSDKTPLFVDVFEDTEMSSVSIYRNFVRVISSSSNMDDLVELVKSYEPLEVSKSYLPSVLSGEDFVKTEDTSFTEDIVRYVMEKGQGLSRERLLSTYRDLGGDI